MPPLLRARGVTLTARWCCPIGGHRVVAALPLPRSSELGSSGVPARRGCPPGRGDLLCGGDLEGVPLSSRRPLPQPVPGPAFLAHFCRSCHVKLTAEAGLRSGCSSAARRASRAACACAKAASAASRSAKAEGCDQASGIRSRAGKDPPKTGGEAGGSACGVVRPAATAPLSPAGQPTVSGPPWTPPPGRCCQWLLSRPVLSWSAGAIESWSCWRLCLAVRRCDAAPAPHVSIGSPL